MLAASAARVYAWLFDINPQPSNITPHPMISLGRKDFPSTRDDLAQALDAALYRFVQKSGRIVDLRSRVFPLVDEIRINLDGAKFDSPAPPLAKVEGETTPAFETA